MSAQHDERPGDEDRVWEVAIVGGGSAGLSAALTLPEPVAA